MQSGIAPVGYAIDLAARAVDTTPPTRFSDVSAFVSRRTGTLCKDGRCTMTSCGDSGTIELTFAQPADDQTPADALGYRLQWLDGAIPASLRATVGQSWPLGRSIVLSVAYDEVASMNGTVALIAIDRAGNESEPSDPVALTFSGCTQPPLGESCLGPDGAAGCAINTAHTGAAGALAPLGALVYLVIRRRRVRAG